MPFDVIFELCIRIFILTILGYYLRKKDIINDDFQNRLSIILVDVVIPLNILAAASSPKSNEQAHGMLITAFATVLYYIFAITVFYFISKALPLTDKNKKQFINLTVFANVGYIGFPIIQALFGNEGMLYAVVCNLIFQLIVFTYGVKNMGGTSSKPIEFLLRPSTLFPIIGIILFLSPFSLPAPILTTFELVGSMSAPFSLFIIGSSLATISFLSVWKDKYAWAVTIARQIIIPFVIAFILKAVGLSGTLAATIVILYGLPSATINVIFAQRYEADMAFATRAVSQGVILMLITLPLNVLLCNWLFSL